MKDVYLGRWGIRQRNESDKKLKFPAGSPCLFSDMGISRNDDISFNERKSVNVQIKSMPVVRQCDLRFLEWGKFVAKYGEFLPKLHHSFSERLFSVRMKGLGVDSSFLNYEVWAVSVLGSEIWCFAVF